jgi:hypothetical protein
LKIGRPLDRKIRQADFSIVLNRQKYGAEDRVENGFCFLSAMRIETSAFFEGARRPREASRNSGDSSVSLPAM